MEIKIKQREREIREQKVFKTNEERLVKFIILYKVI